LINLYTRLLRFRNLLENEDEEQQIFNRYSAQLDSPKRRGTFAQRLKDALKRENSATSTKSASASTSESNYAVEISVSGSQVADQNIMSVK
jgi:poly(ADP-ribose) glycohydrolase